jgi:hypothetical protein
MQSYHMWRQVVMFSAAPTELGTMRDVVQVTPFPHLQIARLIIQQNVMNFTCRSHELDSFHWSRRNQLLARSVGKNSTRLRSFECFFLYGEVSSHCKLRRQFLYVICIAADSVKFIDCGLLDSEGRSDTFLRNVGNHRDYTASQPKT